MTETETDLSQALAALESVPHDLAAVHARVGAATRRARRRRTVTRAGTGLAAVVALALAVPALLPVAGTGRGEVPLAAGAAATAGTELVAGDFPAPDLPLAVDAPQGWTPLPLGDPSGDGGVLLLDPTRWQQRWTGPDGAGLLVTVSRGDVEDAPPVVVGDEPGAVRVAATVAGHALEVRVSGTTQDGPLALDVAGSARAATTPVPRGIAFPRHPAGWTLGAAAPGLLTMLPPGEPDGAAQHGLQVALRPTSATAAGDDPGLSVRRPLGDGRTLVLTALAPGEIDPATMTVLLAEAVVAPDAPVLDASR